MQNMRCLQVQQCLPRKIHILDHKTSLNTPVSTLIIQSIFFDHNGIRLEINNKNTYRISSNIYKLNNTFVNDMGNNKEVKLRLEIIIS